MACLDFLVLYNRIILTLEVVQMENKIVIYTTENSEITFNIDEKLQTVWATQPQIASLFGIDRTTALRHINNILKDEEVDKESNVQKMHIPNSDKPVMYYSLDIILSVGYRTNSSKAIAFRKYIHFANHQFNNLYYVSCSI